MKSLLALAALTAGLGGCGGLETETEQPSTLARLQGIVSDPTGVDVRGELRVAVVWFTNAPALNATASEAFKIFAASEDLPLSASFPANFSLALRNPPPPEAINERLFVPTGDNAGQIDVDPDVREAKVRNAEGVLVIYHDRNGNGRLDLVDVDAKAFVDDVVGVANRALLVWLEGPLPREVNVPKQKGAPTPGFNFVFGTQDIIQGQRVYHDSSNGPVEGQEFSLGLASQLDAFDWRPTSEPLSIELSNHAALDMTMCLTIFGSCLDLIEPQLPPLPPPTPEPGAPAPEPGTPTPEPGTPAPEPGTPAPPTPAPPSSAR
ncbi:MAG: hypothetical protein MUF34_34740 [Polyangiaceae bacterium]|jgi:hypothetical protein|nr:hypothetical protein [Polyangiaceae bacterium]